MRSLKLNSLALTMSALLTLTALGGQAASENYGDPAKCKAAYFDCKAAVEVLKNQVVGLQESLKDTTSERDEAIKRLEKASQDANGIGWVLPAVIGLAGGLAIGVLGTRH